MDRDFTFELELLTEMSALERRVLFLNEKVESEVYWLNSMLDDWKTERSYTMGEIREQRKQVQAWTKRLNEARVKLDESEPRSKLST